MKLSSNEEIIKKFKEKIYSICDSQVNYQNLEICINYYIDKLFDESEEVVLGLSRIETTVLRQYFGFNIDKTSYTYKEIESNTGRHHVVDTLKGALQRILEISKNIKEIIELEKTQENDLLNTLLGNIEISKRAFNALRYVGIYTLKDLICLSKHELLNIKNIGNLEVNQIIDALKTYGLTLKKDFYDDLEITNSAKKKRDLDLQRLSLKYRRTFLEIKRLETILKETESEMIELLTKDLQDENKTYIK